MYLEEGSAAAGTGAVVMAVSAAVAAAAEDSPLSARFASDFLNTVFTLVRTLLSLFSLSLGTAGPP